MKITYINIIILFCCLTNQLIAQNNIKDLEKFEHHYSKAKQLNIISQFSESIAELKIAIEIADKNNWEEKYLNASVTMGEMMRRTGDHNMGVEILENLVNTKKYPKIHVRKLGRMAALYAEGGENFRVGSEDSIMLYLNTGLKIAVSERFEEEEASMSNELGYHLMVKSEFEKSYKYLNRSAKLYYDLKDSNNYVNVTSHIMHLEAINENFEKFDSISSELLKMIKGHEWYGTEQTLYRTFYNRFLTVGDTLQSLKWLMLEKDAALKLQKVRSNNEMSFYRVEYDTEKYKESAFKSDLELKQEKKIKENLILFASILLILIVGIFF